MIDPSQLYKKANSLQHIYLFKDTLYVGNRVLVPCMTCKDMTSAQPSPRAAGYSENGVHTSQVAVVSGGVESVLASPSPPGKYQFWLVLLIFEAFLLVD